MPTRNVDLTDHLDDFIDAGIAAGRFSNASEAVRAGLHLLECQQAEDQAKLEWLRSAAQDAIDSLDRGEGKTFASIDELTDHVLQLGQTAAATVNDRKRRD